MTFEIFLPYWGEASLLMETVASVRAQRDPDWRLTILDDCYPDPTARARVAALADERIVYVRHTRNLGITENYREAIRRATTGHIAIVGSDDLLHPNYIEVVTAALRDFPDADVIQPGVEVIDGTGRPIRPLADRVKRSLLAPAVPAPRGMAVLQGEAMATSLIRGDWLYWPSLVFRTDTLRRIDFRPGLPIIQDLALLMDIAFAGGTLVFTPTVAFSYRRHEASASQRTLVDGTRFRDERAYYAQAVRLAEERGWSRTARAARLRAVSRLHAITELPHSLRRGTRSGIQSTLAHIFSP